MHKANVLSLAKQARARGYDNIERVVARLEALIIHNEQYLARRRSYERHTAYDVQTEEDNQVIALAIALLESTM